MNDKTHIPASFTEGPHGRLAYIHHQGRGPGLFWLGGYASDMRGTKAEVLHHHAIAEGRSCFRFDYSGHGESDGDFADGTISSWAKDAAHMLTEHTTGPQILIGSSMGAWMAGLLARAHPEKVAGMVLIAPAPDFATELTPNQWPADLWQQLQEEGKIIIKGDDDYEMIYTKAMFDDGAQNRVLDQPLNIDVPVRIIQGMKDDVVPYTHATRYAEHISSEDIVITMTKSGDHRMSSEKDLSLILAFVKELTA